MKSFLRTMASIVAAAILLSASASLASAQDPLQGKWTNQLAGGGTSTWTFTPRGGGRYDAQEVGMGNARGTAVLTGNRIHIDFTTADVVGAYDVNLNASGTEGIGQVSFSQGSLTGNVYRDSFRRVGGLTPRPNGVQQPRPQVPDPFDNPAGLPEALKPHSGAAAPRPPIAPPETEPLPETVPPETEPLPPPVVIGEPLNPGQRVEITEDPAEPQEPAPGPPG